MQLRLQYTHTTYERAKISTFAIAIPIHVQIAEKSQTSAIAVAKHTPYMQSAKRLTLEIAIFFLKIQISTLSHLQTSNINTTVIDITIALKKERSKMLLQPQHWCCEVLFLDLHTIVSIQLFIYCVLFG